RLGAVVVNINPSYTAREALIVVADSGLRVLVTLDALAPLIASIRGQTPIEHVIVTSLAEYTPQASTPPRIDGAIALGDLLSELGQTPSAGSLPRVDIAPDDLAVLQ